MTRVDLAGGDLAPAVTAHAARFTRRFERRANTVGQVRGKRAARREDTARGQRVKRRDLAGDGGHYAATVSSESFRGKSRVQQHQIVYQSLKGQMGGVLHALALQTGVPEG